MQATPVQTHAERIKLATMIIMEFIWMTLFIKRHKIWFMNDRMQRIESNGNININASDAIMILPDLGCSLLCCSINMQGINVFVIVVAMNGVMISEYLGIIDI